MAAIITTVTAITEIVRVRMESVPLNAIFGQPTLNSVQHLIYQLATFTSHFATTKWGGNHGFLPLVLSDTKMQLDARNNNLDCKRLEKTISSTQESRIEPWVANSSNSKRTRKSSVRSTPSKR